MYNYERFQHWNLKCSIVKSQEIVFEERHRSLQFRCLVYPRDKDKERNRYKPKQKQTDMFLLRKPALWKRFFFISTKLSLGVHL